jgi:hypothetical protein
MVHYRGIGGGPGISRHPSVTGPKRRPEPPPRQCPCPSYDELRKRVAAKRELVSRMDDATCEVEMGSDAA